MKFYDAFENEIKVGDEVYCVDQWDNTMSIKKVGRFYVWDNYDGGKRAQVLLDHVSWNKATAKNWTIGTCWTKSDGLGRFKRLLKKND
jgi:hypothetical protein